MILMPESYAMRVTFLLGCMSDKKETKQQTQLCELKNIAHHHKKDRKKGKTTAYVCESKKEQLLHLHKKLKKKTKKKRD